MKDYEALKARDSPRILPNPFRAFSASEIIIGS
jgi:hypothetical protein